MKTQLLTIGSGRFSKRKIRAVKKHKEEYPEETKSNQLVNSNVQKAALLLEVSEICPLAAVTRGRGQMVVLVLSFPPGELEIIKGGRAKEKEKN